MTKNIFFWTILFPYGSYQKTTKIDRLRSCEILPSLLTCDVVKMFLRT